MHTQVLPDSGEIGIITTARLPDSPDLRGKPPW